MIVTCGRRARLKEKPLSHRVRQLNYGKSGSCHQGTQEHTAFGFVVVVSSGSREVVSVLTVVVSIAVVFVMPRMLLSMVEIVVVSTSL